MKSLALVLLCFLLSMACPSLLLAQENYTAGYIIEPTGDTIRGFVDNQDWRKNPIRITFKEGATASPSIYSATNIQGFGILEPVIEHYRAVNMNIDNSPVKEGSLNVTPVPTMQYFSGFLRARIIGPISLFELRDTLRKEHLFIQSGDQEIQELTYHTFLVKGEGLGVGNVAKTNSQFRIQLLDLMGACENIRLKDVENLEYSQFHIMRLINRYHECVAPDKKVFVSKKETAKIRLGILAGGSLDRIGFGNGTAAELQAINYGASLGYTAGISAQFVLPRNRGRNAVNWELLYENRRIQAQWSPDIETGIEVQQIRSNLIYQYRITGKSVTPFFGLGFSGALLLGDLPERESRDPVYNAVRILLATPELEVGFLGMVGVATRKFSWDLRYIKHTNPQFIFQEPTRVNEYSIQTTLTYYLGK